MTITETVRRDKFLAKALKAARAVDSALVVQKKDGQQKQGGIWAKFYRTRN